MEQKVFKRRVYVAAILVTVIALLFIIRLFGLHFSRKIIVQKSKTPPIRRGLISDRNGYILSMSIKSYSLFVNPEKIIAPAKTARILAEVLELPEKTILERITRKKRFVWIKRKISDEKAAKLKAMKIPGAGFKKEFRRVFPNGSLGANILGFVGIDNRGIEGIEYLYDDRLTGRYDGWKETDTGEMVHGQNIVLTLDRLVQHHAEREIAAAVKKHEARHGSVVIMEVKTGRVLAMAKYPGFNPGRYNAYSAETRKNFAITDSFEPGSTMKIIALASVLEKRSDLLRNRYVCTGKIEIGDAVIKCTGTHGSVSVRDAIRHSCNSGVIQIMKKMKRADLYKTIVDFGFGRKTGMGIPGERAGILRPPAQWSGLSKYSMAIGYEMSVNSLQLAAAFSAIANGGVYLRPMIIDSFESSQGRVLQSFYPQSRGRIISKTTARALMRLMRAVVTDGTGKKAASRWYSVAGKTGTSQKYIHKKGYTSKRSVSSFAGVAPVGDPEICMIIVIDEPKGGRGGGDTAAPVFSRIADRIFPVLGIGADTRSAPPLKRYKKPPASSGPLMPDFRGLATGSLPPRIAALQKRYGLKLTIYGTGIVYGQKPLPGKKLQPGEHVLLQCR